MWLDFCFNDLDCGNLMDAMHILAFVFLTVSVVVVQFKAKL